MFARVVFLIMFTMVVGCWVLILEHPAALAQPGPSRQERALENIASELKDLNRKLDKRNGLTNDNTRATNSLRDATKNLNRTIGNMR